MNSYLNLISDIVSGKPAKKRSSKWAALRNAFIKGKACAVCNGTEKLEVHHIKPFHMYPDLELDTNNLVVLCESKRRGINCHLFAGHLGDYKDYNPKLLMDVIGLKCIMGILN